ncbi:MAG: RpoL/Rpb11 RNA polymerase subunit family protein [Candidatus Pacearchaeota archaeon]
MEVKVIKKEKNFIEIEIDNLTIAELMRDMLWQDKATELAAWKREHPSKNPHLILRTNGKEAKKVLLETIEKIKKTNQELLAEFKKAMKNK